MGLTCLLRICSIRSHECDKREVNEARTNRGMNWTCPMNYKVTICDVFLQIHVEIFLSFPQSPRSSKTKFIVKSDARNMNNCCAENHPSDNLMIASDNTVR
uniref:Uncharacterized protein n=1 Tax=Arundo donax TaxID=35708 RepID=A0A0A9FCN5_ARUDO